VSFPSSVFYFSVPWGGPHSDDVSPESTVKVILVPLAVSGLVPGTQTISHYKRVWLLNYCTP
jgi:hypothetical protein